MSAVSKGKPASVLAVAAMVLASVFGGTATAEAVTLTRPASGTAQTYDFTLTVPGQGEVVRVVSVWSHDYLGSDEYRWKAERLHNVTRIQTQIDGKLVDNVWEGHQVARKSVKHRACFNEACGSWN
ncbi:hypothetical protein [Amycolatopsis keratiniphila]|uniref:Uncharacterized protein n=1 Tax=Amycolatopsis keratiniphila subsp. keratiniphila TaxID=227715 RepID=A0A1W2LWZ7_9PSEU|nr:hypothetical protein [Amycolatopsis keratiniphila]OLZ47268.1 hypothetical protein BS330_34970 [Amycolatopsis keratiniphila subsp. nogabecina]ONF71375.1 hypothetical protein AVR91_0211865 [Amycolatopsis keratiniphila subsp. keratiniphila]SDU38516.1 hypothetical protein SAMN04489733_3625 [Amycolatopsis keratiniphila]